MYFAFKKQPEKAFLHIRLFYLHQYHQIAHAYGFTFNFVFVWKLYVHIFAHLNWSRFFYILFAWSFVK